MPANTPRGYPYPLGTDRVADGDDAIHNLALAIDAQLGKTVVGSPTIVGSPVGALATVVVTFPVGFFTATPFVVCTPQAGTGAGPGSTILNIQVLSNTGMTVSSYRVAGSASDTKISYIATQI